ncbi:hypothetical protein GWO43_24330 [candidate division KSB1 bacterium]|nr:hypothetical protein [candidate division KSB1 bacterium]NIR68412.1 hypothetical protein [candidate division KSB1 bacterium]NIS27089.1 hypothetical protein [candidate division KSB1 bacterium]NIT73943.1 hypothetical protein [candidate division KSB1 bacterium]NIU27833.1 hypothetical protein [candidate division KSB1 bacterium]
MRNTLCLILCSLVAFALGCQKQEPTADDVVAMMTEAMGGADTLASINDRVETWQFTMYQMPPSMEGGEEMSGMEGEMAEGEMMGEGGMTMEMIVKCKRPNKLRFDFPSPMGTISTWYNGTNGWTNKGGQVKELTEPELQQWEDMAATWMDGYRNYEEKGYTMELLGKEMVEDEECFVLQTTDMNGHVLKNYVSTKTHHLIRSSGEMLNMELEKEPMYMTLEDYKAVDGITLAHDVAQYEENGDMVWEAKLEKVEINAGVEDSIFQGPKSMTAKQ